LLKNNNIKGATMSIRQKIEDALKTTPNISIGELRNQLPEINRGSRKAHFYKLKLKLFGIKSKTSKSEPKKNQKEKRPTES
jgi:hypothetical protein